MSHKGCIVKLVIISEMEANRLQRVVNNLMPKAIGKEEAYLLGTLESISGILQAIGEESLTTTEEEPNREPIPAIAQLVSSINELLDTENEPHPHELKADASEDEFEDA